MTDNFDPNATPECDNLKKFAQNGFQKCTERDAWEVLAKDLEYRARISEEKLRIAVVALEELACKNSLFDSVLFSQDQLQEIEQVGK